MRRRQFLKLLGLSGGAAALTTGAAQAASPDRVAPHPDAVGVLHDSTLCIGCRQCEAACAAVNNRPAPKVPFDDLSVLDKKRRTSVTSYTVVNAYRPEGQTKPIFRKNQCNHCQEPACASACFVKAFVKNADGSVTYDPSLCVGCRYCMIACPFNIPAYDYHKVINPLVHKCTLCAPRIREGLLPGCVESCPNGSLLFGKRADLVVLAYERMAAQPRRYVRHLYGEKEMGGTNWLYLSPVPHEQLGQPVLGTTSVPELTSGALGAVPMIAGLWPVFLTGAYAIAKRKDKIAAEEQAQAVTSAVDQARSRADDAARAAAAKAEKDRETALAKAAKDHETALAAREAELMAEMDALRAETEARVAEALKASANAKKAATETGTKAKDPSKGKAAPQAKSGAKPKPKLKSTPPSADEATGGEES